MLQYCKDGQKQFLVLTYFPHWYLWACASNNKHSNCPNIPGAHKERDEGVDDDGHGASILSLTSQLKLKPILSSITTSEGRLPSKQPAHIYKFESVLKRTEKQSTPDKELCIQPRRQTTKTDYKKRPAHKQYRKRESNLDAHMLFQSGVHLNERNTLLVITFKIHKVCQDQVVKVEYTLQTEVFQVNITELIHVCHNTTLL